MFPESVWIIFGEHVVEGAEGRKERKKVNEEGGFWCVSWVRLGLYVAIFVVWEVSRDHLEVRRVE